MTRVRRSLLALGFVLAAGAATGMLAGVVRSAGASQRDVYDRTPHNPGIAARPTQLELPGAALPRYYEDQRRRGAQSSEALARALQFSAEHRPGETRLSLLERASLADPTLPDAHLQRAGLLLQNGDLAGAWLALREAAQCLQDDAFQQAHWLRAAVRFAHSLLLVTLATLAGLFALRTLAFAVHLLRARPQGTYRALLAATLLVGVSSLASPLLGVLAVLLVLSPFLTRRERRVLAGLCIALAASDAGLLLLRAEAMLLEPQSASALLARAHRSGWDPELETALQKLPSGRERDFVLGLLARRKGDLNAARAHYVASLRADSSWSTAYVNLANTYFLTGDYERAASGYRTAQSFAPDNPFAHANLAQAYIHMLHFDESDAELSRAAELGFEALKIRRKAWLRDSVPVVDMALSAPELRRVARREAGERPQEAGILLQAWRGEAWKRLPPQKSLWLLLAAAAVLLSRFRMRTWAFECAECVRLVCAHCARRPRATAMRLCPFCDRMAPAAAPTADTGSIAAAAPIVAAVPVVSAASAPLEAPAGRRAEDRPRGRLRLQPPRILNRAPSWIAVAFPGAADLARGSPFLAACTALAAWSALLAAAALVNAASGRTSPWFVAVDSSALRLATLVFWLAYLPGLLRLRGAPRVRTALRLAKGA